MNSCEIWFSSYDARSQRGLIRWELFLHHEIKDVLITSRENTLLVVYEGEPDHPSWAATLRAAGFPTPTFSEAPVSLTDDASGAAA